MKRLLFLFLLVSCHGGRHHSLAYLEQYAGRTPGAAGIWNTEPLHTQLKDMTGDRYDQFIRYMDGAGPLTQGKYLYAVATITGGYAYILIDTHTNKIAASIHTAIEIENFQSPGEQFEAPPAP